MRFRNNPMRIPLAVAGLAAISGCTPPSEPHLPVIAVARTSDAGAKTAPELWASATVQALPAYREAKTAYGRGEYRKAAELLAGMQKSAALTADQKEFCHRQELICFASLSPHKTAPQARAHALPATASTGVDCGPRALSIACAQLGIVSSPADLTRAAGTNSKGTTMAGLKRAAEGLKLKAEGVQVSREALPDVPTPCIGWVNRDHYVVVCGFNGRGEHGTATIQDPNEISPRTVSCERLLQATSGYLLVLHR